MYKGALQHSSEADAQGLVVSDHLFSTQTYFFNSDTFCVLPSCILLLCASLSSSYMNGKPTVPDSHESAGNLGIEMVGLLSVRIAIELDVQCLQPRTPETEAGGQ